jgi:hypothetical protein
MDSKAKQSPLLHFLSLSSDCCIFLGCLSLVAAAYQGGLHQKVDFRKLPWAECPLAPTSIGPEEDLWLVSGVIELAKRTPKLRLRLKVEPLNGLLEGCGIVPDRLLCILTDHLRSILAGDHVLDSTSSFS